MCGVWGKYEESVCAETQEIKVYNVRNEQMKETEYSDRIKRGSEEIDV